jgi:hypothetical protein
VSRSPLGPVLAALLLIGAVVPLAAAAPRPAAASVEPADPEIVLPPVILEVEDLSVERVEAKLPPEEELLPPAREMPLVDVGDIAVADPSVPAGSGGAGGEPGQAGGRFLSTDIELAAGSSSHVAGRVSLKSLEGTPRFSLDFAHDGLDGARSLAGSPGYSTRTDQIGGSLTLQGKAVEARFEGSFAEEAVGLDLEGSTPPFLQRLGRALGGKAALSGKPVEWLTLGADVEAGSDSFALEGSGLAPRNEYRVAPSLTAEARSGPARFGLSAQYAYTWGDFGGPGQVHRLRAGAFFEADFASGLGISASAAWFGSSTGTSLVPFEVRITATPLPVLAFSAGGGYRATPLGAREAIALDPLVMPSAPLDDRGWFADAFVRLTLTKDLSVSGRALLDAPAAALDAEAGAARDPLTGLLPMAQRQGTRVASDLALRWGISQAVSLSASLVHEWVPLLQLTPTDSLRAELAALEPAGRWGGNLSAVFDVPSPAMGTAQLPVVTVSGFFAASPVVSLVLTATDLLGPLLPGGVRAGLGGYEEPGFRLTGSLRMRF